MNSAEIIRSASDAGLRLTLSCSGNISVKGEKSVVLDWLDVIRQNKPALITQLRNSTAAHSPEYWRSYYISRGGKAHEDESLFREGARHGNKAFECCVVEWMNENFTPSESGVCANCRVGDTPSNPLLPFGLESSGYAWLHSACWPSWYKSQKDEAISALESMGIMQTD